MCSTPRPKKKVKGKASLNGSLLSNMSPEARSRFAERANVAQERRHEISLKEKQHNRQFNASVKKSAKAVNRIAKKSQKSLMYWLASASLKEVFIMLFFGKSKHI
tara:strand:- start:30 stop:344 length:315 start_codon:yes stop_codon:yes gene_type:complete